MPRSNHKYHCICHGNAERMQMASMLGCSFDEVHVLHNTEAIKKIAVEAEIYNLNRSFDEVMLSDFARKRGNPIKMFSISQQEWVIS